MGIRGIVELFPESGSSDRERILARVQEGAFNAVLSAAMKSGLSLAALDSRLARSISTAYVEKAFEVQHSDGIQNQARFAISLANAIETASNEVLQVHNVDTLAVDSEMVKLNARLFVYEILKQLAV